MSTRRADRHGQVQVEQSVPSVPVPYRPEGDFVRHAISLASAQGSVYRVFWPQSEYHGRRGKGDL